jgi:spore maturation protein CgeB
MRIVIFGLTVSSSWGNGHATIWRGLCSALSRQGHQITFFEKDVTYYAAHRDLPNPPGYELVLYSDWSEVMDTAKRAASDADLAIVTSYCPDATSACDLVLESRSAMKVFYDLDTPVTLERLRAGMKVDYLPEYGLEPFDLVLSYTGGTALDELRDRLGGRKVAPLYGSVDPALHYPVEAHQQYRCNLSYLGTYAADRQSMLQELFLEPARRRGEKKFVIGGAQYPEHFPWLPNIWFVRHVPPPLHSAFYSSSDLTLSVTRAAMADMGYCPSGRLFEAAACGTPLVSDWWEGLDHFFEPGREILVARCAEDVERALDLGPSELQQIAGAARERTLAENTAERRSTELMSLVEVTA